MYFKKLKIGQSLVISALGWLDEYTAYLEYFSPGQKYDAETKSLKAMPAFKPCEGKAALQHVRSPYGYNIFNLPDGRKIYVYDDKRHLDKMQGTLQYEIINVEPATHSFYNKGEAKGFGGKILCFTSELKSY